MTNPPYPFPNMLASTGSRYWKKRRSDDRRERIKNECSLFPRTILTNSMFLDQPPGEPHLNKDSFRTHNSYYQKRSTDKGFKHGDHTANDDEVDAGCEVDRIATAEIFGTCQEAGDAISCSL